MKIHGALLFAALLSVSLSAWANDDAPAPPAEIKQFATAAGAKWSVEQFKYGDLTGRKTKDAAIMLAVNPEHAFGAADDRKLVIALRGADGRLHKASEGTSAMPNGAGPAGGDPQLDVKRNSVFVSQFGGSREKGTDTYQYKNVGGTWRLIGMTSEWYDSLDEQIPTSKTDVNFLTNYVEASLSTQDGKTKRIALYEIPSVKGTPGAGEWTAPYLVLKTKNPADLTARVQSMHDSNIFYLRVTAADDSVLPEDSIQLTGENGKAIEPAKRVRIANAGGYQETLSFNMHKPPFADSLTERPEASFLPLTLSITDADKDASALKTLSTAVSASDTKRHGGLLLMPTTAMPTLQNINVRDGSVHPLVFPI